MSLVSRFPRRWSYPLALVACSAAVLGPAGCGGSDVTNPPGAAGGKLSYAYYQRCIQPILLASLPRLDGGGGSNTCAASGCHNNVTGTGGALRIDPTATVVDLNDAANTVDVIRATAMYKNFYSAQGVTVPGASIQSRLFQKPLLLNVLHGGGLIFPNQQDPNAQLIAYWISHPAPAGQDEFSAASNTLFTPADPMTGACNTQ
jgi:hypothetical protein